MTGLRRCETDTRSTALIVGRDLRGLVEINPIANWSDVDVQDHIAPARRAVQPLLDHHFDASVPGGSRPGDRPGSGTVFRGAGDQLPLTDQCQGSLGRL